MRFVIVIPLLATLLIADPSGDGGSLDRALSLYEHTDYARAIAILKQTNPSAPALELMGKCYFMQGDFINATDVLAKAAALKPADSMIQTWLGRAWGGRAENAFPLAAPGYALKSREAFEKGVQLDAANSEALNDLFDFYMQAPVILGGGMEKARRLLPQIEKADPTGAQLAQARIDEEKKQFDNAEGHFRQAISLAPHQPGLHLELARFLARRGRYDESEKLFQQAAAMAPASQPGILFARARTYIDTRRNLKQAHDLLQQYLASADLTPADPPRWEAVKLLKQTEGR